MREAPPAGGASRCRIGLVEFAGERWRGPLDGLCLSRLGNGCVDPVGLHAREAFGGSLDDGCVREPGGLEFSELGPILFSRDVNVFVGDVFAVQLFLDGGARAASGLSIQGDHGVLLELLLSGVAVAGRYHDVPALVGVLRGDSFLIVVVDTGSDQLDKVRDGEVRIGGVIQPPPSPGQALGDLNDLLGRLLGQLIF